MALAAVDRLATDPVVTDGRMPRMDGLDLVRRPRRRERPIPVLVLTVAPDGTRLIGDDVPVIAKPFDTDDVVRAIDWPVSGALRPS